MDGQQPGQVYKPDQSADEQPQTNSGRVSEEIAQIESAVRSAPPDNQETPPQPPSSAVYRESHDTQLSSETGDGATAGVETIQETPVYQDSQTDQIIPEQENYNVAAVTETPQATDYDEPPTAAPEAAREIATEEQDMQSEPNEEQDTPLLSWQSAGDKQTHSPMWYGGLFVGAGIISIIIMLVTGSWLSAVVVVVAVVAVVMVNVKGSPVQAYGIFNNGIRIENHFYSYDQLRSFNFRNQDNETIIEFEPSKRFYPRITMHAGEYGEQIREVLNQFLPQSDREPDMIDRISHSLKL